MVVSPGRYQDFRIERSGTAKRRIVIGGLPGAIIDTAERYSDHGIYLAGVSHVTVSGFEINGRGRIYFGIAARDATSSRPVVRLEILDNDVHDTRSTGIYLSQVARSLVHGNVAYGSRESHGIYLANAGSDDTELSGNETYDNGRHGLRAFAIDAAAGPAGLRIVNNSFADNRGAAVKLTQDDGGHTIFNNVLLSADASLIVSNRRFRSDYNVVGDGFSLDGEQRVISLAEWRQQGFDRRSRSASDGQVFISAPSHNFLLSKQSVAENAGTRRLGKVRAPRKDFFGSRRRGRTDIGAYERGR